MNRFFSFSKNYLIKQNVLKKQMELLRSLAKPTIIKNKLIKL